MTGYAHSFLCEISSHGGPGQYWGFLQKGEHIEVGWLRAKSIAGLFTPAPLRTGRDADGVNQLCGFLVSLTLAYYGGYRRGTFCRAGYSCVCVIS